MVGNFAKWDELTRLEPYWRSWEATQTRSAPGDGRNRPRGLADTPGGADMANLIPPGAP